jgi:hypothetical protein
MVQGGVGRSIGAPRDLAPLIAIGALCAVGVALAAPEWVPHDWSREDGPIEYATFACFVLSSMLAFTASTRLRAERRLMVAAAALGLVLFVAAGEEISWGQRLFEIETPEALVDGNRQDELNLHNVDGLQDKAVLAQLGIAATGVALSRRGFSWARAGLPFFAGYLAYRAGRAIAAVVDWGLADRNSEAAELLLGFGLLALTISLVAHLRRSEPVALEGRRRQGHLTAPPRPPVARPG